MKVVLLKISGELLAKANMQQLFHVIDQVQQLKNTHIFCFVVGGGNILRGKTADCEFNLRRTVADSMGMFATIINGLFLSECLYFCKHQSVILNTTSVDGIFSPITQQNINDAMSEKKAIIFCGGIGTPFFSTDTASVVRASQIESDEVWKGTKVDFLYDKDPEKNKDKNIIYKITHKEFIEKELQLFDITGVVLANQNRVKIRIFNIFSQNAILQAAKTENFGSIIS